MSQRLDIIIFGATGFTGMHCIPYIHKLTNNSGRNITWGVAGRSETKLKEVLEKIGSKLEVDLTKTPKFTCNVEDEDSIFKMAQQAKVVINCVGPYVFYGEKVIDACLKARTHHIDISGEPEFMEKIQVTKSEMAEENDVYVISGCGMDSIPCDLGVVFLSQKFEGTLNSVTAYIQLGAEKNKSGAPTRPLIGSGTWETFVHNVSTISEVKKIRKQLYPQRLPAYEPVRKNKILPHNSNIVGGWVVPFPGADRSVMRRTQKYSYEIENKRPIQIDTLLVLKSFSNVFLFGLLATIFFILVRFNCGKNLLMRYPEKFTSGLFSKSPPSDETMQNTWFQITFFGEGWSFKLPDKDDQFTKPCDKKMLAKVKGKNPAYGTTCVCLVACALIILTEKDKMAGNGKGGVYSPAAAFANTSLINILTKNGVTFDIISDTK